MFFFLKQIDFNKNMLQFKNAKRMNKQKFCIKQYVFYLNTVLKVFDNHAS